jgi:peptidoglycan/xylan/chitin deacetylase (PgdA/CDA1 family)
MKRILFLLLVGVFAVFMASCDTGTGWGTDWGTGWGTDTTTDWGTDTNTNSGSGSGYSDKLCALTFDDGPDVSLTPLVLDKLDTYGVPATFFMIGQLINNSTSSVINRIVSSGHEIGNHSWGWDSLSGLSQQEVSTSYNNTSAAIQQYAGTTPKFFRPPNLATSSTMYAAIDVPFVSGVLGRDWSGEGSTAQSIANNVMSGMRDGAIILLHDVQPLPHPTPDALDILIPQLQQQGYEFVTLSELFQRKGITPVAHQEKLWVYVE